MECHSKWNVNQIEGHIKWNVIQNGMLLKMEYHSKWNVTRNGMCIREGGAWYILSKWEKTMECVECLSPGRGLSQNRRG